MLELNPGSRDACPERWSPPGEIDVEGALFRVVGLETNAIRDGMQYSFRLDAHDGADAVDLNVCCFSTSEAAVLWPLHRLISHESDGYVRSPAFPHDLKFDYWRSPDSHGFQIVNFDFDHSLRFLYGTNTWISFGNHGVSILGNPAMDKAALAAEVLRAGGVKVPVGLPEKDWTARWKLESTRFLESMGVRTPHSESHGPRWTPPQESVSPPPSAAGWAGRWRDERERLIQEAVQRLSLFPSDPRREPMPDGERRAMIEAEVRARCSPGPPNDLSLRFVSMAGSRPPEFWRGAVLLSDGYCLFRCGVHTFETDAAAIEWFAGRVGAFHALSRPHFLKIGERWPNRYGLTMLRANGQHPEDPFPAPDKPPLVRVFVLGPRTVLDLNRVNADLSVAELLDLCAAILRAGGVEVPEDGE